MDTHIISLREYALDAGEILSRFQEENAEAISSCGGIPESTPISVKGLYRVISEIADGCLASLSGYAIHDDSKELYVLLRHYKWLGNLIHSDTELFDKFECDVLERIRNWVQDYFCNLLPVDDSNDLEWQMYTIHSDVRTGMLVVSFKEDFRLVEWRSLTRGAGIIDRNVPRITYLE